MGDAVLGAKAIEPLNGARSLLNGARSLGVSCFVHQPRQRQYPIAIARFAVKLIDNHLKFSRLHDRQVDRLRSLENSADVAAGLAVGLCAAAAIADQAASLDVFARGIERGDRVVRR
jgi:hypothetical protein